MPDGVLSALTLHRALQRLSELAATDHIAVGLALCHGAVIALVYSESPKEGSRTVEGSARAIALAQQVAAEMRLPPNWIEEDVRFYLALANARHRLELDQFGPNLILSVAEPEHLLAMKLEACQDGARAAAKDIADLQFLLAKIKPASVEAVVTAHRKYFPGRALTKGAMHLVAELMPATNRNLS